MDILFKKLKQEVEAELGRPIEQAEEIELKSLYYFSRGVKLKNQLESEPEQLGDICKRVLEDMRGRVERRRVSEYKARVLGTTD